MLLTLPSYVANTQYFICFSISAIGFCSSQAFLCVKAHDYSHGPGSKNCAANVSALVTLEKAVKFCATKFYDPCIKLLQRQYNNVSIYGVTLHF